MFIVSIRASTVKLLAVLVLTAGVLVSLFATGTLPVAAFAEGKTTVNFSGMKTNEDRVNFLKSAGIAVKEEPVEEEKFTLPEDFDRVLIGYNEIQKKQGLDLSRYEKRKVTRYTYEVEGEVKDDAGAPYEGKVYANLLIYRDKIIACDLSSADPQGFVRPIVPIL